MLLRNLHLEISMGSMGYLKSLFGTLIFQTSSGVDNLSCLRIHVVEMAILGRVFPQLGTLEVFGLTITAESSCEHDMVVPPHNLKTLKTEWDFTAGRQIDLLALERADSHFATLLSKLDSKLERFDFEIPDKSTGTRFSIPLWSFSPIFRDLEAVVWGLREINFYVNRDLVARQGRGRVLEQLEASKQQFPRLSNINLQFGCTWDDRHRVQYVGINDLNKSYVWTALSNAGAVVDLYQRHGRHVAGWKHIDWKDARIKEGKTVRAACKNTD
ncbi:hypothetical protein K458DRAFT_396506 [Lentithecium fluviatile CBS 122367]|uniref:Uncharacterized protein n=1 Tax=Lentithecium fluviatile CBS 122367 TaxID=1168545 RepID=A0A6G1IGA3_9PLEO|nr:hypothetical protein K458DRAFT_396506 [Lentithecium fluviatile CBS 122367]